jgi:hypothetical protein
MPKNRNYFENIAKEINDVYQANRRTSEMANTLAGIARRQAGQLVGAVVKGAKYDSKGRRTN